MTDLYRPKGFSSAVIYRDGKAALRWLERAFGFEPLLVLLDKDGNLAHSEMTYGESVITVGNEWGDTYRSPLSVDGKTTQFVRVQLAEGADIDAHCAHARASGAVIVMEPTLQFYGEVAYRARDPEGHLWTFSVTVKQMTPDEWDAASGLKTVPRLD